MGQTHYPVLIANILKINVSAIGNEESILIAGSQKGIDRFVYVISTKQCTLSIYFLYHGIAVSWTDFNYELLNFSTKRYSFILICIVYTAVLDGIYLQICLIELVFAAVIFYIEL